MRRWNYEIYYDESGEVTHTEAVDVTINDDYDILEEHDRYECQTGETGQPILESGVPVRVDE